MTQSNTSTADTSSARTLNSSYTQSASTTYPHPFASSAKTDSAVSPSSLCSDTSISKTKISHCTPWQENGTTTNSASSLKTASGKIIGKAC